MTSPPGMAPPRPEAGTSMKAASRTCEPPGTGMRKGEP
jgi:hypothetical protein